MDPQTAAILQAVQEAINTAAQARAEQGWTAGAVAIVLGLALCGLAWGGRQLYQNVRELNQWRTEVLQDQLERTTTSLDASATSSQALAKSIEHNTTAVNLLRDAIRAAPCGIEMRA